MENNETFKVIKERTIYGLELVVNQLALEGWETSGPLTVDNNGDYIQSMVKKPEEETQVLND